MSERFVSQEVLNNLSIFGNEGEFWVNGTGKVLYLDLKIDKTNSIPSDSKINRLVCSVLNVAVRSFDDEYLDKNVYWVKSFSYWIGDKNA